MRCSMLLVVLSALLGACGATAEDPSAPRADVRASPPATVAVIPAMPVVSADDQGLDPDRVPVTRADPVELEVALAPADAGPPPPAHVDLATCTRGGEAPVDLAFRFGTTSHGRDFAVAVVQADGESHVHVASGSRAGADLLGSSGTVHFDADADGAVGPRAMARARCALDEARFWEVGPVMTACERPADAPRALRYIAVEQAGRSRRLEFISPSCGEENGSLQQLFGYLEELVGATALQELPIRALVDGWQAAPSCLTGVVLASTFQLRRSRDARGTFGPVTITGHDGATPAASCAGQRFEGARPLRSWPVLPRDVVMERLELTVSVFVRPGRDR